MTNRIKSASVAVFANDTQLDRLQAFGVSARLDSEDLREIGNLDIVEVVDSVPTVDITLDANQYGSVKTLNKLANKNHDWSTCVCTLSASGTVSVSSGYIYKNEMQYTKAAASTSAVTFPTGASQHKWDIVSLSTAGAITITQGTAVAAASTPSVPTGVPATDTVIAYIETASTSTSAAVPMTYLNILNVNGSKTLALTAFEFSKVDFVVPVKETGDNTDTTNAITRSMYVENAFVNRYDAAFSTNGLATENYSLESDNKTWFLNSACTVVADRFAGTAAATGYTTTSIPTQRDNGNRTLKAYLYNVAADTYTALTETSGTASGTQYSITSAGAITLGTAPTTGSNLVVRYATTGVTGATQPFFRRVPQSIDAHPVVAGGLKQGQVEIYLSDDPNNHVLRLQSCSISSTLAREPMYELGHVRAYDRPMTFPIPITIQVEAIASDLKEFARLAGKSTEFSANTLKEVGISQFLKNLNLSVKIYREDDVTRALAPSIQSLPIKTITVTAVVVTDENTDIRVDGNGTQTFGLKANTNLSIVSLI
jgi:hypothetical protein